MEAAQHIQLIGGDHYDVNKIRSSRAFGIGGDIASQARADNGSPTGGCIDPLLSPKQVSLLCGLHVEVVRRAIRRGELKASKLCGKLRIRPRDFESWVDQNSLADGVWT